jgi:hypothetical protein
MSKAGSRARAPDDDFRDIRDFPCLDPAFDSAYRNHLRGLALREKQAAKTHARHAQFARRAILPRGAAVALSPKSNLSFAHPPSSQGAYRDRHDTWSAGCGGCVGVAARSLARGRTMPMHTAKSCGPGAPTLALSCAKQVSRDDGGKKARSPGRARRKRVPWKGTVLERVQVPSGKGSLRPVAIGAVGKATTRLKPPM